MPERPFREAVKQEPAEQHTPQVPVLRFAVAVGAASACAAVAAAGVLPLLVLADQVANDEKDNSK